MLLGTAPETARGTAVGLYHTTNDLATFGAPLIGTALATYVRIGAMLPGAAGLRLLGEVLFLGLGLGHSLELTP